MLHTNNSSCIHCTGEHKTTTHDDDYSQQIFHSAVSSHLFQTISFMGDKTDEILCGWQKYCLFFWRRSFRHHQQRPSFTDLTLFYTTDGHHHHELYTNTHTFSLMLSPPALALCLTIEHTNQTNLLLNFLCILLSLCYFHFLQSNNKEHMEFH